ncbi:MAG TPA: hypothetical protein VMU19_06150 [Bryobacteraceae bacterium]|nr:hypothetical protein [Bryobacteraceae bacterium]
MTYRILATALVFGMAALGQPQLEFSAKIGVPVSQSFQTSSFQFLATGLHAGDSATRRYTAGAGLAFSLHRFGAEVDLLYKRLGYDITSSSGAIPVIHEHTWTTANSWEVPILGVYRPHRFGSVALRVAGGVSFRAVSGEATTGQCVPIDSGYSSLCGATGAVAQPNDEHLSMRSSFGGTCGAGMETRLGPVRLAPEVRYTRWRADAYSEGLLFDLRSNPNQIDFLLGIGFARSL